MRRYVIISYILLALMPLSVAAQEQDDEKAAKVSTVSFSPDEVMHQKRYNPRGADTLLTRQAWWRRLYLGVGGGVNAISDNVGGVTSTGFDAHIGYRLTPIHSLRLNCSAFGYRYANNEHTASTMSVGLDYEASLTDYMLGYNPKRMFDAGAVVGAGMRMARLPNVNKTLPYAYIGVNAQMHLGRFLSVYAEPYVGLQGGLDDVLGRKNPDGINLMYGVWAGARFSLEERVARFHVTDSTQNKMFLDISSGVATSGISDLSKKFGYDYNIAVGYWMNPFVGLRVGIGATTLNYKVEQTAVLDDVPVTQTKAQAMMRGRAEVLINPLNISRRWREKEGGHLFEFNVLAGGEFGWMRKSGVNPTTDGPFRMYYYGFTTALQGLLRVGNPGTYLYIEPRYTMVQYDIPYQNTNNSKRFTDNVVSLSIGTRLYMTAPSLRFKGGDEFVPRWWFGFNAGAMRMQEGLGQHTPGQGTLYPAVGLVVGYDWKKYASLRFGMEYQHVNTTVMSDFTGLDFLNRTTTGTALWDNTFNVWDLRFNYMLNLNNLLQGYDSRRRFNLWLTAGPAVTVVAGEHIAPAEGQSSAKFTRKLLGLEKSFKGKAALGLNGSIMASYDIGHGVEVTAEALAQYNISGAASPGSGSRLNQLKYGMNLGMRYNFTSEQLLDFVHGADDMPGHRGWFAETAFGLNWLSGIDEKKANGVNTMGCGAFVGGGYWLNSRLGARMSLGLGQGCWSYDTEDERSISYTNVGGRLEVLVDPLYCFGSIRRRERPTPWDANVSLGMSFGSSMKTEFTNSAYVGFTTAMTGLYRVGSNTHVFVEPRIEINRYWYANETFETTESRVDKVMSLSIGARVTRPIGSASETETDAPRAHRGFWTGLSVGFAKQGQRTYLQGNGGVQPALALTGGYDFGRLHSVKLDADFEMYSRKMTRLGEALPFKQVDARLLYMLNLTNLWTGRDKRNPLTMYLEVGPAISAIVSGEGFQGKIGMGLVGGTMLALKLTRHWDVTAEGIAQINVGAGVIPMPDYGRKANLKLGVNIGARYNF